MLRNQIYFIALGACCRYYYDLELRGKSRNYICRTSITEFHSNLHGKLS